MRGFSKVLSSGLLFFLLCLPVLFALELPKRADGYVTDHARLLSPSAKANLEALLKSFEDKTSNQVIVATFPSLEGNSLEDFSMRLAEAWKVGQKGKDNGVIFLIFKNDRKIRIEVGYGLEGVLTDATSGQIINQVVAPYFRKEDYQSGIFAGVDAIMQATQGEFKSSGEKDNTNLKLLFLFLTFILTHWILRLLSSGTGTGGQRFGGGTGFYTGGYWGGGGSSGGGFGGGGGFSGGGGSFGGGGASGRW